MKESLRHNYIPTGYTHLYIKKKKYCKQLRNGIGNNEEDDHKMLSIVWGESLLMYGEHVSLIQSATAETVQLCNTLTTT